MRQDGLLKALSQVSGFFIALVVVTLTAFQYVIVKPSIVLFRVLSKVCFAISELLVALDKKIKQ